MLRVFRTLLFLIATISLLITSLSCHRTPIEPEKIKANLIYEDALCTEAYLRLKLAYIDFPANVDLYVDKNKVNSFRTFSEDTVIMVENLLPKKSYTSYVKIYPAGGGEIVSNEVSFTTMDTTSHYFTWQVFEFGNFVNSFLYDVAIINENDIWAVGEIYVADTNINGYTTYNAVHWDGNNWELKQIEFFTFCPEGTGSGIYPANSIYAFDNENIVISSESQLAYLKNGVLIKRECVPVSVEKIWGLSRNDFYIVGYAGNIAHWDGKRWTKIEGGTGNDLYGIWGSFNKKTNKYEIMVVGHNLPYSNTLLGLENNVSQQIKNNGLPAGLSSIWFSAGRKYYIVGEGIYYSNWPIKEWKEVKGVTRVFITSIHGNDINDIMVVGNLGDMLHFNGVTWNKIYFGEKYMFYEVKMKDNLVVAVGYKFENPLNQKAFIIVGKRFM